MPNLPLSASKQRSKSENRTRLAKFLAQPLRLEEHGPPRTLNQLLAVTFLFVTAFMVWTMVTEIQETAMAPGQVQTEDKVTVVQHLEGGIIQDILVSEGDVVKKGQPLVRLAGRGALADLGALRARQVALTLESERLRAFVGDRPPDFSAGRDYPHLVNNQAQILDLQLKAKRSKEQVLKSRIAQRRQELGSLRERLTNLERRFKLTKEAVEMRRKLVSKGLVSRLLYLESEQAFAKAEGDIAATKGEIKLARESLNEAETSLKELDATTINQAIEELGRAGNELAQINEAIKKSTDRADRLVVTASAAGTVKGLIGRSRGSVIGPTDVLMEIVPKSAKLVAEVKVSPRDIGYVRVGQDAKIRITTYHVARFGSIDGKVTNVSPSTFRDERGEPYYKATIALAQTYVGGRSGRHPILPGMVANADVITGSKTLSTYLLLPIYRSIEGSFGER